MGYNKMLKDTLAKLKTNVAEAKNQLKLAHLLSYEPHITVAQLRTISCPTLVIGGDHDVIRTQHTMLIAQSIPNSYLWIIPNSGHSTPIYKKEQFNQIVGDFFAQPFRTISGYGRFN
jgi:pimeloyl-ACP methyl ester carboxylesterase